MTIPKEIYGRCPVCGGNGPDDPNPPDGFATARDTEGSGYPLVRYKGELMCQLCKKRLTADDESLVIADNIQKEEEFRASAGFRKTMES